MNYSLANILKQEPSSISAVFIALANLLPLMNLVQLTADQVNGMNVALVLVLSLFYVRPLTASKDALSKLSGETPPDNPDA